MPFLDQGCVGAQAEFLAFRSWASRPHSFLPLAELVPPLHPGRLQRLGAVTLYRPNALMAIFGAPKYDCSQKLGDKRGPRGHPGAGGPGGPNGSWGPPGPPETAKAFETSVSKSLEMLHLLGNCWVFFYYEKPHMLCILRSSSAIQDVPPVIAMCWWPTARGPGPGSRTCGPGGWFQNELRNP